MDIEILRPFGPSIVKVQLPLEIINQMNEYTNTVVKDQNKSTELDHGKKLVGNVQQEIVLEVEFMKKIKWAEFLASACKEWVKHEQNKQLKSFQITKSWIVRQFKHEYNPIHWHSGHISGVGYLKVPNSFGKTYQENKQNNNGKLVLVHGSRSLFSESSYIIKPKVGDLYMFPSYLMHSVYPFYDTDEERRSISFNAKIDEDSSTF